jgi:hypothetical protein
MGEKTEHEVKREGREGYFVKEKRGDGRGKEKGG